MSGGAKYDNAPVQIAPLSPEHLPLYADVIRESFSTVAKELNLTRENCRYHNMKMSLCLSLIWNGWFHMKFNLYTNISSLILQSTIKSLWIIKIILI
ncbi:MAG: hypothetical protein FWF77_05450 [Defluviitaleaceae bacterium]|nr:hypothetical protein [Defluviitaleaceae bacterium]